MDIRTYAAEAVVEADHWWFVGRRHLFARMIEGFGLPRDAAILDVGTSTGTNLRLLGELGFRRVQGVDRSPEAVRFCADKGLGTVELGDACALPYPDRRFDLVLATDIIEHVDDDAAALRELHRVLKPGAPLLVTVPSFAMLWGLQDEVSHHKRRYRLPELSAKLAIAGFAPRQSFYFNYLLFLPILAARQVMRRLPVKAGSETEINTPWLNRILTAVFDLDVWTAPHLRPPFGVSALVLATRE